MIISSIVLNFLPIELYVKYKRLKREIQDKKAQSSENVGLARKKYSSVFYTSTYVRLAIEITLSLDKRLIIKN